MNIQQTETTFPNEKYGNIKNTTSFSSLPLCIPSKHQKHLLEDANFQVLKRRKLDLKTSAAPTLNHSSCQSNNFEYSYMNLDTPTTQKDNQISHSQEINWLNNNNVGNLGSPHHPHHNPHHNPQNQPQQSRQSHQLIVNGNAAIVMTYIRNNPDLGQQYDRELQIDKEELRQRSQTNITPSTDTISTNSYMINNNNNNNIATSSLNDTINTTSARNLMGINNNDNHNNENNNDQELTTSRNVDHPDAPENDDQEFSILNIIPTLISEKHRKAAFVENLVDTAGLIIEVIWANFSVSPSAKIITLRVFLQETLRRSRTSYSTLQTALFYLFRIKSIITSLSSSTSSSSTSSPSSFFSSSRRPPPPTTIRNGLPPTPTSEYPPDSSHHNTTNNQNNDPATCGRRMFLAALIVASKYLQDRNYSNRAWSKISGLPVNEINANEICFLKLIDYDLFISEDIFKRWSSLLLTHIQAISGTEISSPDAFRRSENQKEVSRFREILKSIDPQTMDCKRPTTTTTTTTTTLSTDLSTALPNILPTTTRNNIYPNTPAASAPGSPRIIKSFRSDQSVPSPPYAATATISTLSCSPIRALDISNMSNNNDKCKFNNNTNYNIKNSNDVSEIDKGLEIQEFNCDNNKSKLIFNCQYQLPGNSKEQCNLGNSYLIRTNDEEKAFQWYLKSAEGGNNDGQCYLGYCYDNGIGTAKNDEKPFQWLKSAEVGNRIGQDKLGNGIGIPTLSEEAGGDKSGNYYTLKQCWDANPKDKKKSFQSYNNNQQQIKQRHLVFNEQPKGDDNKVFENSVLSNNNGFKKNEYNSENANMLACYGCKTAHAKCCFENESNTCIRCQNRSQDCVSEFKFITPAKVNNNNNNNNNNSNDDNNNNNDNDIALEKTGSDDNGGNNINNIINNNNNHKNYHHSTTLSQKNNCSEISFENQSTHHHHHIGRILVRSSA